MFASRKPAAQPRTCAVPAMRTPRLLQRLRQDQSGNVAMLFGLLVIPLAAMIGLAVDFGRVYSVTSHTQAALDAAALAAGRTAQLNPSDPVNQASAAAQAYFNQAKPKDVVESTLQFSPNAASTQFSVSATSWVKTPFLSVLYFLSQKASQQGAPAACGSNGFGCVMFRTTATSALCPSDACVSGNNGGSNVEVALMLDITGSMCSPCTKLDALQSAAKDLIDIVVPNTQTDKYLRVALAPFAEAVNVGTALAPLVRGTVTSNSQGSPQVLNCASMTNTSTQPDSKWIRFPQPTSGTCRDSGSNATPTTTWQISSKCVTERIGAYAYKDDAPTGSTTYVGKGYFGTNTNTSCAVANYTDAEVNSIFPLSESKSELKGRIDKLKSGGSTAGHLGTAWAWYLLSPNWNGVLQQAFPSSKPAGPYSDLVSCNFNTNTSCTPDPVPPPALKKIAVLMTDGDYNINYCKGAEAKDSDQSPNINCNSEDGKSLAQATSLCTGMKNAKIEVYTIGFQVSSAAKTFLTSCATNAAHYYDATTELSLQAAFRDIALKITRVRLTN
jgi:Flp pilus assembly protein TadG